MEFSIRRAEKCDVPRINELFIEMLCSIHHTDNHPGYADGALDYYFTTEDDIIYAAEKNGEIIGFLAVEGHHDEGMRYAYIDDFSVTAEHRSKGVGARLLDCAETFAREHRFPAVYLNAETFNRRALSFYEKHGYSIIEVRGSRATLKKTLESI